MPMAAARFIPLDSFEGHSGTRPKLPRAALFDMDGVLISGERARFEAYSDVARERGLPLVDWDEFVRHNMSVRDLHAGLKMSIPWVELKNALVVKLEEKVDACLINADAAPLLEKLRREGVKLAVVTNNFTPFVEKVLRRAGLRQYFDAIVTADDIERPKPDPQALELALGKLGVAAEEAWMVGDTFKDGRAADAAGVSFVGLGVDGGRRVESLAEVI